MQRLVETDLKDVREEKNRVPLLEEQLKAAQELNLSLMEATAALYEQKLAMEESQLMVMGAVADVFEMVLTMQGGN